MASKFQTPTYEATALLDAIAARGIDAVIGFNMQQANVTDNCVYFKLTAYGKPFIVKSTHESIRHGCKTLDPAKAAELAARFAKAGKSTEAKFFLRPGPKIQFDVTLYPGAPPAEGETSETSPFCKLMLAIQDSIMPRVVAAIRRGTQFVGAVEAAPTETLDALRARVGSIAVNDIVFGESAKSTIRAAVGKTAGPDFIKALERVALFVPDIKLFYPVQVEYSEKSDRAGQALDNPIVRPAIKVDLKTGELKPKFGKIPAIYDMSKAKYNAEGKCVSSAAEIVADVDGKPINAHNAEHFFVSGSAIDFTSRIEPLFSKSGFSVSVEIEKIFVSPPPPAKEIDDLSDMYGEDAAPQAAPQAAAHAAPQHAAPQDATQATPADLEAALASIGFDD